MEVLIVKAEQKRANDVSFQEIKKWADTFDVLGNPLRLAIVVILYGSSLLFEGERSLTFSQIMSVVHAPSKPALASYLRELIQSGLVEKYATKDKNERVYPIYSLSDKGKDFLNDFGLKDFIEKWLAQLKQQK